MGGVRQIAIFADVQLLFMLTYGESQKFQKCADVIKGWTLDPILNQKSSSCFLKGRKGRKGGLAVRLLSGRTVKRI